MPIMYDEVRKLATVEEITEILPIQDADAIVAAKIRGWTVVIKKGEFEVGDRVIYFEEDTALPLKDPRFAFLAPRGLKEFEGENYHVLKIARLRKVYSQGLAMPFTDFKDEIHRWMVEQELTTQSVSDWVPPLGTDVTSALGLGKWERPVPLDNQNIAGPFLTKYARQTDSERVQNLQDAWSVIQQTPWDITEKIDGTSMTALRDVDGTLRVMGRNWEISPGNNVYWNIVEKYPEVFDTLEPEDVVQLEVAGPNIQGNKLQLPELRPFIFEFAKGRTIMPRDQWPVEVMKWAVPSVPIAIPDSIEQLINEVDGMHSIVTPKVKAEGVVFHTKDGRIIPEIGNRNTFKVISNAFLLKQK